MRRPPTVLLAVLAVGGLGVGVASATLERPRTAVPAAVASTVVPVADAVRVCPDPSGVPDRRRTVLAAAVPAGAATGGAAPAPVTLAPVAADARPAELLPGPGRVAERTFAEPSRPLAVAAQGALAPGLAAVERSRTDGGPARGLAGVRCGVPGTRFTFLGFGTTAGEDPRLYLTNVEDVPALLDLTLTGSRGPLPSTAGQGLRVPPHGQVVLRLVGIAPGQAVLAATVAVRSGRVAAALRDTRQRGELPRGDDWVAPAAAPARTAVVPGIDWHDGRQLVTVSVPGATDATVRVAVVRLDGSFVPTGLDGVEVRAGTVRTVDVTDAVDGRAAAVRLTADQPVQAGVTSTLEGSGGYADVAFGAATRPLEDVVVPNLPLEPKLDQVSGVQLVAPAGAARVRVVPLPVAGAAGPAPKPLTVTVEQGRLALVDAADDLHASGPVAVELQVLPGSGPVYAAAYWYEQGSRGPMLAVLPLVPETRTLVLPAVRPDPLAPYGPPARRDGARPAQPSS